MKTLYFKTNLKCNGCVNAIAPAMNEIPGLVRWETDLIAPESILTVVTETDITENILEAVRKAGYTIEPVGSR